MVSTDEARRTRFEELKPGDRIAVHQTVDRGSLRQVVMLRGTVVRVERVGRGRPGQEGAEPEDFQETLLLELPDGELTVITMDDRTVLNRA